MEGETITLTKEEYKRRIEKAILQGRRTQFTFWRNYFCNCEISRNARAMFKKINEEITEKEKKYNDVRL